MKNRNILFDRLMLEIKEPDPFKKSLLFHHVFTLKMGSRYVLESFEDFTGLVSFLNQKDVCDEVMHGHVFVHSNGGFNPYFD